MIKKNPELVLASSSRYRRELLERLGIPFTAEASDIDETSREGETPVEACQRLAVEKAKFRPGGGSRRRPSREAAYA